MQESIAGSAHTTGRLVTAGVNVRTASGAFRLILDALALGPIKITGPLWHCLNIPLQITTGFPFLVKETSASVCRRGFRP